MTLKSIFCLSLAFAGMAAQASTTPEMNRALLQRVLAGRTGNAMNCAANGNAEAVLVFNVDTATSGAVSASRVMVVQDEQICQTLGVACPFVAGASRNTGGLVTNVQSSYLATRGKYEDTLLLFSDNAGMKLVSVANGSTPQAQWNQNWYFNAGECSAN